jgi:hypothetical protein
MAKDSRTLRTHVVEATVPLIHRKAGILVNEAVFNDAVVRICLAEPIHARKFLYPSRTDRDPLTYARSQDK